MGEISDLLKELDITPVLMDVGASGGPPPIWRSIASRCSYIGFDPDLREIHEDRLSGYQRSVIINEAVTERHDASEIPFYLTRSPYCSTTLDPNPAATAHWLERDLFDVQSQTRLRATTIDSVLSRRGLSSIDWIKLDTQGTDLRLINSISPEVFSRIMAIDTEPGLIEVYQCEDMFVDVHRDLTKKGFWLSGLHTGGFRRMRRTTVDKMRRSQPAIDEEYLRATVRTSPAYFEARYLRTLEWLADHAFPEHQYTLLWIFALLDDQLGFAQDVSVEVDRRFGDSPSSRKLNVATRQRFTTAERRHLRAKAVAPVARALRWMLRRALPGGPA